MTQTARRKLELGNLSALALSQRQGLDDIDLEQLHLQLHNTLALDITADTIDGSIARTVEGGSTISISLTDDDHKVLRSGKLSQRTDIEIDDLWFRLRQVRLSGPQLDLTFEDRAISVLRTYNSKLGPVSRAQITRAQFILRMIKEVSEFQIPVFIPELLTIQPIEKTTDARAVAPSTETQSIPIESGAVRPNQLQQTPGSPDFPSGNAAAAAVLTVKNETATTQQKNNATIILRVAKSKGARRKVMVAAIMGAIQESSLMNLSDAQSPGTRSGIYQQDPRYWPASGDVGTDAAAFLDHAIGIDRTYPNLPYYELVERVQASGLPLAYAPWRTEAEHFVTAFGEPGGDTTTVAAGTTDPQHLSGGSDYFFYRGIPPQTGSNIWKPEDSWTAIQRLASDVGWRAFFIANKFYYLTEDYLFRSSPRAVITFDTPGLLDISGDYDQNKKTGQVTLTVIMKRWAAPPGSIVVLRDMGPYNGRWLVSDAERSLYSEQGTITLKKPNPLLPEPATGDLQAQTTRAPITPGESQKFHTLASVINPIPSGQGGSHGAVHATVGLAGYPALDFFADAGTPVLAPETGVIERFSGHDPALGPIAESGLPGGVSAAGGPLGWSIYMKGDQSGTDYYMTHLGSRIVQLGQHVTIGMQLGTVADYARWGRASHVHLGVNGGSVTIDQMANAEQAA